MRSYILFLALLCAAKTNAQWNIGVSAGANKAFYYESVKLQPTDVGYFNVKASPSYMINALVLTDNKERIFNFGLGVSLVRYSVHNYSNRELYWYGMDWYNTPLPGTMITNMKHESFYTSINPTADFTIGKKGYFHFLVNPAFQFLLSGKENGYVELSSGDTYTYENAKVGLKKFVLGINTQAQFRYPFTKYLDGTLALGYSINNTTDAFLPTQSGSITGLAGLSVSIPRKVSDKKDN